MHVWLLKTILYDLIMDYPFETGLRERAQALDLMLVPRSLRDIVQMFANMNPDLESDVRQEMKAALVAILQAGELKAQLYPLF